MLGLRPVWYCFRLYNYDSIVTRATPTESLPETVALKSPEESVMLDMVDEKGLIRTRASGTLESADFERFIPWLSALRRVNRIRFQCSSTSRQISLAE